jgi:putative Mg2+ transporter-C (MgtC) family protein
MEIIWREVSSGVPDIAELLRIVIRLLGAVLLAGVVGFERERTGKAAGLRTHMLVALGSALFVIAALESGLTNDETSRVVQGVVAGIGFIGAGAILKRTDEGEIQGLTTAAGIWMTAAVGVAAGLGSLGVAAIGVAFAWVILAILSRIENPNGKSGA